MKTGKDQNEKLGGDKRKFEYLVRSILNLQNAHGALSQEMLDELGSEGWHLVFVHQGQFIFEREA